MTDDTAVDLHAVILTTQEMDMVHSAIECAGDALGLMGISEELAPAAIAMLLDLRDRFHVEEDGK